MLRTKVHYASYRGAPGFIVKHIDPFPTKTNSKPFRAMVFRQGTDEPLAQITALFSENEQRYIVHHVSGRRSVANSFITALLAATGQH